MRPLFFLPTILLAGLAGCSGHVETTDHDAAQGDGGMDKDAAPNDGAAADADGTDARADDASAGDGGTTGPQVIQWQPVDLVTIDASDDHGWNEFPVQVVFTHEQGMQLTLDGYWSGGRTWRVRFAAPLVGRWTWTATTQTEDPGLQGSGVFTARPPSTAEIGTNPNYHGHVVISGSYFQYSDGTTFLPLGDTFWKFNTTLPLGNLDGGFAAYLDDRTAKGFNSVLVEYIDTDPDENANEGGYVWDPDNLPPTPPVVDWTQINPAYFDSLDERIQAFWEGGLVIFGHPFWIVEQPEMTVRQAADLSRYLLARYGAFNMVWSLTGEFHLACNAGNSNFCDNDYAGVADLGRWVGGSSATNPPRPGYNPFGHPMSVHPGGWDVDDPDPDMETSRLFDQEDWLDHHWIQTYAETDKIVYRVAELRGAVPGGLTSHRPVLMSEPNYENFPTSRYNDWDQGTGADKEAGKARRQAWTAMYVGAAGYIYGAQGVWQAEDVGALDYAGSSMVPMVKDLLLSLGWPALQPDACVEVQQNSSWQAPALDYPWGGSHSAVLRYTYAPRCLIDPGHTITIYIPAGNEGKTIRAVMLQDLEYRAEWFDPRNGTSADIAGGAPVNQDHDDSYLIPARPAPSNDDWVLILTAR